VMQIVQISYSGKYCGYWIQTKKGLVIYIF
jgi:hypothetical protein